MLPCGQTDDVVGLERQPDAALERKRGDVLAGELKPPGAIEHGKLLGDDALLARSGPRSRRRSVSVAVRPSRIPIVR